jgi:HEAT repeat protein
MIRSCFDTRSAITTLLAAAITAAAALAGGCTASTPAPVARSTVVAPALLDAAKQEIVNDLQSDDAVLRSNALEAMKDTLPEEAPKYVLAAMNDPSAAVRFAACMAAGELKLDAARDQLILLHNDASESRSVRVAAIFGLHKLGDYRYSHELEKDAFDDDPRIRGITAMILGLLGEPTGVRLLGRMQSDIVPAVRLQADEAMWRLGDQNGLVALVSDTISKYPDDQIIGVIGLAEPKDQRVAGHVYGMLQSDYPEVSLAAARAMGMLGSDAGYSVAAQGAVSKDARQRFMAAMAFGAIGRPDAQGTLSTLLKDDSPSVRLGAATALLQLKPPVVQ